MSTDSEITLSTLLPNEWVLYIYDKQLFKKLVNKPHFNVKPYTEICTISTVNDLLFILKIMKEPSFGTVPIVKANYNDNRLNLDMNDYIIMRKGIEPIWEDPRNSNGGTFTIKMDHSQGYNVWSKFVLYMIGETMTYDMDKINGITVSYIADSSNYKGGNSNNYSYIKIWDGQENRTKESFIKILPVDLYKMIERESLLYTHNNTKKDFNKERISNFQRNNSNQNRLSNRSGFKKKY